MRTAIKTWILWYNNNNQQPTINHLNNDDHLMMYLLFVKGMDHEKGTTNERKWATTENSTHKHNHQQYAPVPQYFHNSFNHSSFSSSPWLAGWPRRNFPLFPITFSCMEIWQPAEYRRYRLNLNVSAVEWQNSCLVNRWQPGEGGVGRECRSMHVVEKLSQIWMERSLPPPQTEQFLEIYL